MWTEVKGNWELIVTPALWQEIVPTIHSTSIAKGNDALALQLEHYRALHSIWAPLSFFQTSLQDVLIKALEEYRNKKQLWEEKISQSKLFLSAVCEIALLYELMIQVRMWFRNMIYKQNDMFIGETDWPIIELTDEYFVVYMRNCIQFMSTVDFSWFVDSEGAQDWIWESIYTWGLNSASKIFRLAKDFAKGHGNIKLIDPELNTPKWFIDDTNERITLETLRIFQNALMIIAQANWKVTADWKIEIVLVDGKKTLVPFGTPRGFTLWLQDMEAIWPLWMGVMKWADRLYPEIDETKMIAWRRVDGILEGGN